MAKESRRLRRSRNVSSFLEDSLDNATPPKTTVNVVVDVHNGGENSGRRQRDGEHDTEGKETKRSFERSSQSSRTSSRANEAIRNRRGSSRDLLRSDDLRMESLDLIEEFEAPRDRAESLEEKPRRRKQWSTVANVTGEAEVDPRRPPRKRWSKDAGVIRLPETSDNASDALIDDSRKTPVPAPRTNLARSDDVLFDNPAFVPDNEDEVLRIETDHNRESTKIEMRRMSDRSNVEDSDEVGSASGDSSRRHQREGATLSEHLAADSGERSSRARSSVSRRNSVRELDSSASLERIADVRSNSITSSSSRRSQPEGTTRDQSSGRRERSLLRKKQPPGDDAFVSSSARIRKKRKKKRRQEKEKEKMTKEKEMEEMKYISVTIHRADVLEADYMSVRRPMVRVHIVEARTGLYLKSTTENGSAYLQPMLTGKFDFKKNRSMIPVWEEELIFRHNFDTITSREDGEQMVILFEVMELLSFADASLSYDKIGSEGCWNKIAWAFLKPVGINNTFHTGKKVRLQLYKPRRSFKKYERQRCEVYTWWQSNNRDKYPSSLLVTVKSILPPKLEPVLYQKLPINDLLDDVRNDSRDLSKCTTESIGLPKWARLAAQSCKVPNEKIFETEVSEKGCFYVAFSNDGKYLACVHSEEYYYPIVVYEVGTSGKIHVRFLGHKSFVYSLNWSSDDHYLLSASADQTARIWDVRNQIVQHIEMLPHPSYVYCAKYGPGNTAIVATGCYDQVIRIWANDKRPKKRELNQELEGHEGFVNSMVFQKNGNLITADSVGLIILWTIRKDSRSKRTSCISRKIKIREIEGIIINTIVLHPLESRLLVHSRDNGLRMLDLATGVILQKYKRLNNQRIQLKACISPCGGFVMCGSEDSVLNIWNLETGRHVAKYTNGGRNSARMIITCVDYHPYDHVLAYSIFGSSTSVRVLRYNKNASGNDVGLHLTEDTSQTRGNEVILNALSCPPSRHSKSSGDAAGTKEILLPHPRRSTVDHMMVQIDNNDYEQWTMSHHSREMERNWRKKSWDRLHSIIEKIDSILFGNSMFFEDVAEAKRSSSADERGGSWTNVSNNNVTPQCDILLEDRAASATRSHDRSPWNGNNTQSSYTTASKSPDHSFSFNNSAAPFKKTNTPESSHMSSPDSVGTYIVETSNFNKNVEVTAKEIDSVQVIESDSSRISNVTFLIENERIHK